MEARMLQPKFVWGVWGVLPAYVMRQHIKVVYILLEYDAYLSHDKEMITRAPIVDANWNLKEIHDWLDIK